MPQTSHTLHHHKAQPVHAPNIRSVRQNLVAATVISIGFALGEAEQRRIAEVEAKRADSEKAIAQEVKRAGLLPAEPVSAR